MPFKKQIIISRIDGGTISCWKVRIIYSIIKSCIGSSVWIRVTTAATRVAIVGIITTGGNNKIRATHTLEWLKYLNLSDKMLVYCGHEYTLNNIKFLEHIFKQNKILESAKKYIISDLSLNKRSIPFHLGDEKKYNPFLNQNCEMALELRSENNYSDFEFFRYLREEKDSF